MDQDIDRSGQKGQHRAHVASRPNAPPDLTPIQIGEVQKNPVTGERAIILELPWKNPEGRAAAELTALVGARVVGEHRHPTMVERFTVKGSETLDHAMPPVGDTR